MALNNSDKVAVRLPSGTRQKLKIVAAKSMRTMNALVSLAVLELLEKEETQNDEIVRCIRERMEREAAQTTTNEKTGQ